ncbi:transporter substrate-binding domain-containing protein [Aquincola sp. MAHUQ-54]|uniref:Transporter substrate-binding domain-containing protein n=1 Tax=Aquincola agrisoli TaxID=3119538 RepID=A0AAW9Q8P0_9BURK
MLHDLAPSGRIRCAINLGNSVLAQRDPSGGKLRGVSVDLARALGERLGVEIELVLFDAAGKVFEAMASGAWDVAFLAEDPKRASHILFTLPYLGIEGAYMVPAMASTPQPTSIGMALALRWVRAAPTTCS